MSVLASRIGLAVLGCVVLYVVPLVRVVSLEDATATESDVFVPSSFAREFWEQRLLPGADAASPADVVLAALDNDADEAGRTYGRRVGVSRGYFLFLQGEGIVGEATSKGVLVEVADAGQLILNTGPIFGSAVRDASGLIDASVAPSSRDYNGVAAALNGLAEELVVPELKAMPVGIRVGFVGCAKVSDPEKIRRPLSVVPVRVEAL